MSADAAGRTLPHGISRSWLLVNALDREGYDSAVASAADQLIIDLEDAVDPSRRAEARRIAVDWLADGGSAWVRINSRGTLHWYDDRDALADHVGLRGVVLAKTESAREAAATVEAFGVPVIPLLESASGIEGAVEIGRVDGVVRLAFGSGDYRRDTGTSATELALAYPRSRLVVASRASGLPGPIDGPSVAADDAAIRRQSLAALEMGMTARLCVAAAHTAIVNESMSPSPADVQWASDVVREFDERGGVIRDGSDPPRIARARSIAERARALAIA